MKSNCYSVRELPESERPYEKCEKYGAGSLSDAELIAVIIRTGSRQERSMDLAARILKLSEQDPGLNGLHNLSMKELLRVHGIGKVKAVQILCIAELSRRMAKASNAPGLNFTNPDSVARYYMEDMRHLKKEVCRLALFDTKSRLLGESTLSVGTVNASIVSPREVFLTALKLEAVHIILLHNHPSGDPTPSKEDILVTKRVKEAGDLVGISLMDHIIIGDNKYVSLKEQGFI